MSFLLWHRRGDLGIASTRRVLRAAEVPVFDDALTLCGRLQGLHDSETARLDAACAEGRERGYQEGLAAGRRAASDEHAARLTELGTAAARQRDQLEGQLAALALQVARKLIGSLADDERLVALAQTAARELMPDTTLTLVVNPSQAEAVAGRLAAVHAAVRADAGTDTRTGAGVHSGADTRTATGDDDGLPAFELREDASVPIDTCRLDTGLGSVDATLDTQLRRIAQAWGLHELPPPRTAPGAPASTVPGAAPGGTPTNPTANPR